MPLAFGHDRPFGSAGGEAPPLAPAPADRPLTVPLLVRGALDSRALGVVFWLGVAATALGACVIFQSFDGNLKGLLVFAAGLALLALAAAMLAYLLPRRLWLQVTASGFVITRGGADQAFGDEHVVALSRDSAGGQDGRSTHRVVLEVQRGGDVVHYPCRYSVAPNQDDPLAAFWDRLAAGVAERVRQGLARGEALAGPRWRLAADGLHLRGDVTAISRLRKVGYFDGRLCVWRDDDERPFARLPRGGRNVQPLAVLLWELIRAGPHANAPLPGRPLGRVILDRRSREWQFLLLLFLLFALVATAIIQWRLTHPFDHGRGAFAAFSAALLSVFATLAAWSWFTRVRFHEYGVVQPGLWRTRALRYDQIATMTCRGTNLLLFEPAPGSRLPAVRYWRLSGAADEGLKALRDHVAWLIAARWAERLAQGPVGWTLRLRFLPGGLEYRAWQLFGLAPAVTVPYHYTHYLLIGEELHLHVAGSEKPVCKESAAAANFYPGLALLEMIYEGCRPGLPEADRTPAPRGGLPAREDTRIVGGDGGPTGVTPAE